MLVPDLPGADTQLLDARDLAMFIVDAAVRGVSGAMNVAGVPMSLTDFLSTSAEVAGHTGVAVGASADWLVEHDVEPWMGPRSLPLWLPDEALGMSAMDTARAAAAGLRRRPIVETLADTLLDERARGLDRPRKAGLTRDDELELLTAAVESELWSMSEAAESQHGAREHQDEPGRRQHGRGQVELERRTAAVRLKPARGDHQSVPDRAPC